MSMTSEMTTKRSSDECKTEEPVAKVQKCEEVEVSTEDIEEAMWQVKRCAARDRAALVSKAKEHFFTRNGFAASQEELDSVFDTLRDRMIDEDTAQSTSDDEEEEEYEADQLEKLQNDMTAAFEHVKDLAKEDRKRMKAYFKQLWCKENNGGEPSQEETDAVFYNVAHMARCMVVVEDDSEGEDEDYEPSELEKEACDAEQQEEYEHDGCAFDYPSQCSVTEEQFEAICMKFVSEKGRKPTSEETDALLECFASKLTTASLEQSDDEDYSPSEEEESEEDESLADDTSLEQVAKTVVSEAESEADSDAFTVEHKSYAFSYMQELEEGSSDEEVEQQQEDKKENVVAKTVEATEPEKSKVQQSQEMQTVHQVCA